MSAEAIADVKEEVKCDKPSEEKPAKKEEETPKKEKEAEKTETKEKENENPKSPEPKENGEAAGAEAVKLPTLREQFKGFSKFGDTKSDGKHLTLSQSDKWMKQAKVIDGKTITTTDTAIHFKKFKQMKITFPDYEKYLQDLAKGKNIEVSALKNKLRGCGAPGTTGTTAVLKNEAVDRLTDTKKFTGSHKIRVEKGKASPSPKK